MKMQQQVEEVLLKVKGKKVEYELCPYGIEYNNHFFINGHVPNEGSFVLDEEFQFPPEEISIPVFERFVRIYTIWSGQIPVFIRYSKNKTFGSTGAWSSCLDAIFNKYSSFDPAQVSLFTKIKQAVKKGGEWQQIISQEIKKLDAIEKEKNAQNVYLDEKDIQKIVDTSNNMKWAIYQQYFFVEELSQAVREFKEQENSLFTFKQRHFDNDVLNLKRLIKRFEEELKKENRDIIITPLIETSNKKEIHFSNDSFGYKRFVNNIEENFIHDFRLNAQPHMMEGR